MQPGFVMLAAGCALALSAFALERAAAPFAWISASWLAVCAIGAMAPRSAHGRLLALYAAAALATLGGFDAWLSLGAGTPPETITGGSYHDGGYFVAHPILGYAPKPGVTVTSTRRVAGELIYDVSYTIDENGLRRSAPPAATTATQSIVFFGCSMTFGEGLEDDETAAARVAQAVGDQFRVYNFGFHGYGPQHMLAAIEGGLFEQIVREPPALVVFQTFSGHLERSAGRATWDPGGPRYRLRPDGGSRARVAPTRLDGCSAARSRSASSGSRSTARVSAASAQSGAKTSSSWRPSSRQRATRSTLRIRQRSFAPSCGAARATIAPSGSPPRWPRAASPCAGCATSCPATSKTPAPTS